MTDKRKVIDNLDELLSLYGEPAKASLACLLYTSDAADE